MYRLAMLTISLVYYLSLHIDGSKSQTEMAPQVLNHKDSSILSVYPFLIFLVIFSSIIIINSNDYKNHKVYNKNNSICVDRII